ncbi:MAG: TonB-dependent receptor [Pseudomonadota bacterium]
MPIKSPLYQLVLLLMKYFLFLCALLSLRCLAFPEVETLVVTARVSEADERENSTLVKELMPGARNDAAEFLSGLPGVQADSRSNYAQDTRITLRGFGARSAFGVRGVDLQIDGIPLSMPDGQGQFSGVVLDGVSQINVLTGPVAALYGNGAGGVIRLQTQAPVISTVTLGGAMDESGLVREHVVGEWQQGDFAMRGQANHLEATGDRPHASAERDQLGAQIYYRFANDIQAQLRLDKENAPRLEDPLGLTLAEWQSDPQQLNPAAEFFNTRKQIHHQQTSLSLRQAESDKRWQIALWNGKRAIEQFLAQKGDAITSSGGVVDLRRNFNGANGNYTWDIALNNQPASITLGAEYSTMDDQRKGYINIAGERGDLRRDEVGQVDSRDTYVIAQWQPIARWKWLAGLRKSNINFSVEDDFVVTGNSDDSGNRKFAHLSKALETRYEFTEHWLLHAGIGGGFETPTLTETAYTSGDRGFNQTLEAAQNRQQQVGIEYRQAEVNAALTAFRIDTQDEIVVDQSQNGRTSYRNAAATLREGIELSSRWQWSSQWNSRFASSYLSAKYTQGEWSGMQLPGVAAINHYLQINWQPLSNDYLQASISVAHRSAVATHDNNVIKAPASTTADIALSGRLPLGRAEPNKMYSQWWIKLANITDEIYVGSVIVNQSNGRAFEPAPERNLLAGITIVLL